MKEFLSRHKKAALFFSGGKDSIACLELLKPYLDKIVVIWVNTGSNFPEVEECVTKVALKVSNFVEIPTNQAWSIEINGYPADVVPVNFTKLGQDITKQKNIILRSYLECCNENLWSPSYEKVKELGITGVIRGQRADEDHRAPIKSGYIADGIEYFFPLQDWSNEDVNKYLEKQGVEMTERLMMRSHTSLDCWNCTAFTENSVERMEYMKKHHPNKHQSVVKLLQRIDNAVMAETLGIKQILGK
jgi:3'-phosphoadenosine 5'-phosphosulfate sulfotransferase (PAPS reductase)/FAD synthetase